MSLPFWPGHEVVGVVEAVGDGVDAELVGAIAVLDKGATLMTVGVPAGRTAIDLDLVQDRELTIMGNLMYVREDVLHAIELLRKRPFPYEEVVTATFRLEDADQAFRQSDDPEHVKILVRVGAGDEAGEQE